MAPVVAFEALDESPAAAPLAPVLVPMGAQAPAPAAVFSQVSVAVSQL